MTGIIRRWLGPNDEDRENADWRPAGSLTFLDAKVMWDGYEALKRDGDAALVDAVTKRFVQIVEAAVQAQDGVVSMAVGDALLGVFQTPLSGVIAAIEAHRATIREPWPDGLPVQGRYALYTGEAEMLEEHHQYRGDALGYALRLGDEGQPGHIRMGERTARETRDALPAGVALLDDGEADIDRFPAEHVYTLELT